MTPTLNGRMQTRVLVLGVVGLIVLLGLTPLLPTGSLSVLESYRVTSVMLAVMLIAGVVWELLYHLLQQLRWEKDWPTLFGLVTIGNEGLLMWVLVHDSTLVLPRELRPSLSAFAIYVTVTWLAYWLVINGPMRVLLPRWRFNGGRII